MSQDHAYVLPAGYMLEEYRIERMLGSGGFGITYLAHDTQQALLGERPVPGPEPGPNPPPVPDDSNSEKSGMTGGSGAKPPPKPNHFGLIAVVWIIAVLFWLALDIEPSDMLRREVPTRAVGEVFQDALKGGGEGPEMVVLPTGRFRMSSPAGEEGRDDDEGPVRKVTIGKRIAMGRYEVTVGEFRRFVTASGYRTEAERIVVGKQGCYTLEIQGRNKWDWTPGRIWTIRWRKTSRWFV